MGIIPIFRGDIAVSEVIELTQGRHHDLTHIWLWSMFKSHVDVDGPHFPWPIRSVGRRVKNPNLSAIWFFTSSGFLLFVFSFALISPKHQGDWKKFHRTRTMQAYRRCLGRQQQHLIPALRSLHPLSGISPTHFYLITSFSHFSYDSPIPPSLVFFVFNFCGGFLLAILMASRV